MSSSSSSSGPILEGILAINKPPAISSAQVIRDVQEHFNPSRLFKPWLDREHAKRDAESHNQKRKRKWRGRRETSVKMGHGGTLDPMATGVLILGIGSGTKQLSYFSTECTKSYETVVLFGAATDSYDTEGKVVGRMPYEHITRDMVEEALAKFRGKGMQKPPIFSALRIQGKRLYEYAREGKEPPVEIQERPVDVHELEMLEWMEGGTHKWQWPEREAEKEEKTFAEKALHLAAEGSPETAASASEQAESASKRKREGQDLETSSPKHVKLDGGHAANVTAEDADLRDESKANDGDQDTVPVTKEVNTEPTTHDEPSSAHKERPPCPAPACRIRMKVTSGFYVRSLCHDLGAAIGSLGLMADLVRTQQGSFQLGHNVLLYDELQQGEDVWGPKVRRMLEASGEGKNSSSAAQSDPVRDGEDDVKAAVEQS